MKTYNLVFVLVVTALLSGGCQNNVDKQKEREALLWTDREFSEYSMANGAAEAFKMYFLEDAVQLPREQLPIYGRDKIYQELMNAGEDFTLAWEPSDAGVAASGELGYTWGIYTLRFKDEAGEWKSKKGKYMNVWEKDPNGEWRVLIDMGNQNPSEE